MIIRFGILQSLPPLLLAIWSAGLSDVANAKKSEPTIIENKFDHQPTNLFYFDNSEVVLFTDADTRSIYRSTGSGDKWEQAKDLGKGQVIDLWKHPYDDKTAVALGDKTTNWITKDRGETWTSFKIESDAPERTPLAWHATDPDRIIYQGSVCDGWFCTQQSWYTIDGFKTVHVLRENSLKCLWAVTHDRFTTGDKDQDNDRILCIVEGKFSPWAKDFRLLISDDYFKSEVEPTVGVGRAVKGIVNMAAVKGYIVVAAKAEGTDELALYVTDDAKEWHRAEFGNHRIEQDAFTILESTNYSIQVDVMTSKDSAMGVLFTSNSNGTYFTRNIEHTNRNRLGFVDFEKIQNIQGIVLVNTVDNWEHVEKAWGLEKKVKTSISFDDGRTFQSLMAGKKELHLHSVTDQHGAGRVFSSPAPGLVMGVGNTGDYLDEWEKGDTWVSDDAGVTWIKALDGPTQYEFGDQGSILVAIASGKETDVISYSLDHGHKWEDIKLDDKIKLQILTTVPDSTSLKFLVMATKGSKKDTTHVILSIDFDGLHERKCKKGDFEEWHARRDSDGQPSCVMGHTQAFDRRKPDADCFIDEEFSTPEPEFDNCRCTDADYECDYNFVKSADGKTCEPAGPLVIPDGACKNPDDTFKGSSGYRLIPGNTCLKKGGVVKDEPVERKCKGSTAPPADGKIVTEITPFPADSYQEYFYLERTSASVGDDETLVLRTSNGQVYQTHDHGKTWHEELDKEKIVAIYPHQYFNDVIFFITDSKKVFYSKDRVKNIHHFNAPEPPNQDRLQIMGFHPEQKDWLLWTGAKDCRAGSKDCHSVSYVSLKGGVEWKTLLPYVRKCQFMARPTIGNRKADEKKEKLMFCEQFENEDENGRLNLVVSEDWFEEKDVRYKDVVNFATMSEFIIVAVRDKEHSTLRVDASVDGSTFASAKFPHNFQVQHQQAYTVLDSSTHSIFLHVTVQAAEGKEYGAIIKSNSNGTSYVMSLRDVNRNTLGYVDFEKLQGLEGVAVANQVANVKEVESGKPKKLATLMTHNDGAIWTRIKPPRQDLEGNRFPCSNNGDPLEKCSLHLHGYTERKDPRDTYSSPAAPWLMMGLGNVGESLGPMKDADTFISRDAGVTWATVKKGRHMWEYGDQGAIIVIVSETEAVNSVFYSSNNGQAWKEHQFSNKKYHIDDISTVPSDTSRKFILWGREEGNNKEFSTIHLDFSGLTDKKCFLDEKNSESDESDYELWTPSHPSQTTECLFGHIARYHRKKLDRLCYNGEAIDQLHEITENCPCDTYDFECDYNYERDNAGNCILVSGLKPTDHSAICREDPEAVEYFEPTGFRRIPLTTCKGGKEFDAIVSHPCPNHEKEYNKKHGPSGFAIFLAIVIPFAAAGAIGYYFWRNWDGKFGRIRLGEAGGATFDSNAPWIAYPVAAISATVAVLAATPLLVKSLWRSLMSLVGRGGYGGRTYTSRQSFARGRGDYATVDTDEGELLGDESDEEV